MEKIAVTQVSAPPFSRNDKFHVRLTSGRFQNLRRLISWPLLAAFFASVWIQVDGQPGLHFSFAQHQIIIFGHGIPWHDLPLLAGGLIAAACTLFFAAVAYGRVWCGFSCPQSIWTWLFIRIEDLTEGRAYHRAQAQDLPLTGKRLLRRLLKHLLWMGLAIVTAITFTGYFVPIRDIIAGGLALELSTELFVWLVVMASITYLNAGLVREKICLHACPYSRFQTVMFDSDTRTVSYNAQRGEPRAHKRNAASNSGDCIDCTLCVQVCPTGIDIRDGLQAACIDCGACIDACDKVMNNLNRATGLIRFVSENQLKGKSSPILRLRLVAYGVIVLGVVSAVLYGFTNTTSLLVEVHRDRTELYTRLNAHTLCNDYRIKAEGFTNKKDRLSLFIEGPGEFSLFGPDVIDLRYNNATWQSYRVCARDLSAAKAEIIFHFIGNNGSASTMATFLTDAF
ncbi:MAG: cytochrome c oxidase accessory protein CcoG [Pseudomonadales bacterium]|nr:cytochrome c oxidase accessory protein CcoG [Pseudomonadales bacterium]